MGAAMTLLGGLIAVIFIGGLGLLIVHKLHKSGALAWLSPGEGKRGRSLSVRLALTGCLVLLTAIPLEFIEGLVRDRLSYQNDAHNSIATAWGESQTLAGPVLVVPYTVRKTVQETAPTGLTTSRTVSVERSAVVHPDQLTADISLAPEQRARGMHSLTVYGADAMLSGTLTIPENAEIAADAEVVHWDRARLMVLLSDTRAIISGGPLVWDGADVRLEPGARFGRRHKTGILAAPAVGSAGTVHHFDLPLSFRGSETLRVAPSGVETDLTLRSSWPHPSFDGAFLPTERAISDHGFTASWKISHLARAVPRLWTTGDDEEASHDLTAQTASLRLIEPVDLYGQVLRAAKYGLLIVGMTFLVFLVFELACGVLLHPAQQAIIALALSVFYLLLLSLAEQTTFLLAYGAAAGVTVGLIVAYAAALLQSWRRAAIAGGLLGGLYGILYMLLQAEDHALLMGAGLTVTGVAALMWLTRNLRTPLTAPEST